MFNLVSPGSVRICSGSVFAHHLTMGASCKLAQLAGAAIGLILLIISDIFVLLRSVSGTPE